MTTAILMALTLLFVELFLRLQILSHTKRVFSTINEVRQILQSSEISDVGKEAAARKGAKDAIIETGIFSAKFAVILLVVGTIYWLLVSGLGLVHNEFYNAIVSWKAVAGLTMLTVLYVRFRNVLTR